MSTSSASGHGVRGPRPSKSLRSAAASFNRILEVVDVDVLEWDTARSIPQSKARVPTDVILVDSPTANGWRDVVPRKLHKNVERFLRRSDVGCVAVVDGRFAGWVWLSRVTHRDPWSGLRIRLTEEEAYAYALWVLEEFRPVGVAALLMARILGAACSDGSIRRVYGWVDETNLQSAVLLRMIFGFSDVQRVKRIHVLRHWGRQVPFSARPAHGPMSRTRVAQS